MKKLLHLISFALILVSCFSYSQQLTCGDTFTDSGGANGNYLDNENITTTICADNATSYVSVSFTSFITEGCCDFLMVYQDTTLLGAFAGTNSPGTITSSIPGGCLTFVWSSDESVTPAGWVANVTCNAEPVCLPPTNLATLITSPTSISLTWLGDPVSTNFDVIALPCGSAVPTATTTGWVSTTVNSYEFSNLNPNTCYTFYARVACSETNTSAWSAGINATTPSNILSCGDTYTDSGGANGNYLDDENITTSICPETSTGLVSVTFTSFNTEAGFDFLRVYQGTTLLATFVGTVSPGTISSTIPGACLSFVFTSDGSVIRSGWVAEITCFPPPTCPNPTGLSASNITTNSMNLNWTSNSSATVFNVIALPCGSPVPNTSTTGYLVSSTNINYLLNNLLPETCYDVYVRDECNATDFSEWRGINSITTLPTCPKPTNLIVLNTTSNSATFAWVDSTASTNFNVIALPCNSPLPNATTTGWIATTLNPYELTNLNPNTCYTFYVRTICSETDTSSWSVGLNATTQYAPPECGGQFTDLGGLNANYTDNENYTITICPDLSTDVVTVTFTAFNTEEEWDGLYVFDGNSINSPQIASTNPGGNVPGGLPGSYWGTTIPEPFTSSSPDGCLTFRFISDNIVTRAGWNATVTCQPPPTCPKPTNLIATNTTFNSSTISWNSNVGTTFNVLALPCGSPVPSVTTTGWIATNLNPYTFANLNPDTCYTIYVRAVCTETDLSYWSTGLSILTQTVPPECGGTFTDIAGANLNYANNSDSTVTICPEVLGELVTVAFTQFNTQESADGLYVYDGNSTTSQQIASTNGAGTVPGGLAGSFWGTTIPGPFTSSSPDGCLTFRFRSGAVTNATGWVANVTCSPGPDRLYLIAFIDSNNNGVKEPTESIFHHGSYVTQMNNSGIDTYVNSSLGSHSIFDTNASNTYDANFVINSEYSAYFNAVPTNYNDINIPFGGGTNILHFPITIAQAYSDVSISIIPIGQPRAGFSYVNRLIYTNQGVANANGSIIYTKDPSVTITAVGQPGITVTATGFTYNFTNLLPNESRIINVTMSVPSIPTVNIGDILTNTATIVAVNDININNNSFSNSQIVIASYDPNDKMESRGERVLISEFTSDDYLYYTIRFENTGTAEARSINVVDLLDSQLDENSIRMVGASHPYVLNRNGNNLNWYFENINLPVSVANTLIGKGYVMFKVKPLPGFAVGTIIPNAADIYFESNPAITTNTFNTEFVSTLANVTFEDENFVLYPNPANNFIQVNLQNTSESIDSIVITDLLGKNVSKTSTISSNQSNIDVSNLAQGIYFVEITTQNNLKLIKKLIKK